MSLSHILGGTLVAALAAGGLLAGAATSAPAPRLTPIAAAHASSQAPEKLKPMTVGSPGTTPYNDSWASALDGKNYTSVSTAQMDTKDATTESGEQLSLGAQSGWVIANTVWVKWTAPASGVLEADTINSNTPNWVSNTTLAVFTGSSLKKAKRIAYNDNDGTLGGSGEQQSRLRSVPITAGVTYHFQVGVAAPPGDSESTVNSTAGYVELTINPIFAPPSNDNFANAKTMTGSNWTATGTTVGSTLESGEPTSNDIEPSKPALNSVWYKWTPSAGGTIAFTSNPVNLDNDNVNDQYLAVFQYNQLHGTLDDAYWYEGSSFSYASLPIHGQSTYYFQVGQVGIQASGPVNLRLVGTTYTGPVLTKISSHSGPAAGNKVVKVTGKNLTGTTDVCFGSGYCTTHVYGITATSVSVTTPAAVKGTYDVYVISNNERSNFTSSAVYTFK